MPSTSILFLSVAVALAAQVAAAMGAKFMPYASCTNTKLPFSSRRTSQFDLLILIGGDRWASPDSA